MLICLKTIENSQLFQDLHLSQRFLVFYVMLCFSGEIFDEQTRYPRSEIFYPTLFAYMTILQILQRAMCLTLRYLLL